MGDVYDELHKVIDRLRERDHPSNGMRDVQKSIHALSDKLDRVEKHVSSQIDERAEYVVGEVVAAIFITAIFTFYLMGALATILRKQIRRMFDSIQVQVHLQAPPPCQDAVSQAPSCCKSEVEAEA